MSQNVNSGLTAASITGNITAVQTNIPLLILNRTNVGTIGTVPANKIWRIYYLNICGYSASNYEIEITLDGVDLIRKYSLDQNINVVFPYPLCIVATAGQVVALASGTSGTAYRAVVGYTEESV